MPRDINSLARDITLKGSRQTYFTIKLLVDKPLVDDCYKAYAYFRWLDDQIDEVLSTPLQRKKFIQRQKKIINSSYEGKNITALQVKELMMVDLIKNNLLNGKKLESFIKNFLAVIEFDANRKNINISQQELNWYTSTLGKAVTDGIEYFVGNGTNYFTSKYHYSAATAAHITHILRDYKEDVEQGYYNMPTGENECEWVQKMVDEASKNFLKGKKYIHTLPGFRIKLVALLYCARFEWILKVIKCDNYNLRENYFPKTRFANIYSFLLIFLSLVYQRFFRL